MKVAMDVSLDGMFQEGDVLPGGWVRLSTACRRLSIKMPTLYKWHTNGVGVGRGKHRKTFMLRVAYFGGDARTRIEWLSSFFEDAEAYRRKRRSQRGR
jgi:hypothetical protein